MLRQPPNVTENVLHAPAWERVAWALREEPQLLDDVARARMERNLVDAWRVRNARAVPLPTTSRLSFSRSVWAFSLAMSATFGAVFAWSVLRDRDVTVAALPEIPARFDLVIDDGSVQSGFLTEGQVLESGRHGRVEVALEQSRVDVAPDSRVRFERLGRDELRLSLMTGRLDVAYHPERRGQQHMSVETRSARVHVVGTQFAVEVDGQGNTKVSVTEGVVQVVPRGQGITQFVHAGQQVEVPIQAPAERERHVREGIESRLRGEAGQPSAAAEPNDSSLSEARTPRRAFTTMDTMDDAARNRSLEAARGLIMQGKHALARERLHRIAKRNTLPTSTRVEALVLIAESYTSQGQIPRAADTYRDAVNLAPHHPAGYNALFALARLNDRYTEDRSAAGAVYREYLERAPRGALASQARDALCRLGDASSCK
ncbi:MAG: FecR domain-containing protein [Polyangiales bacterium]